jgi:hypothetical protein
VLVRLHGEEKAQLPPGDFLPFEHYHLMPDLDRWGEQGVAAPGDPQTHSAPAINLRARRSRTLHSLPWRWNWSRTGTALLFEISEAPARPGLLGSRPIRAVGCGLMVGGFGAARRLHAAQDTTTRPSTA